MHLRWKFTQYRGQSVPRKLITDTSHYTAVIIFYQNGNFDYHIERNKRSKDSVFSMHCTPSDTHDPIERCEYLLRCFEAKLPVLFNAAEITAGYFIPENLHQAPSHRITVEKVTIGAIYCNNKGDSAVRVNYVTHDTNPLIVFCNIFKDTIHTLSPSHFLELYTRVEGT